MSLRSTGGDANRRFCVGISAIARREATPARVRKDDDRQSLSRALRVLLGSFSDSGIINDPPYVAGRSRHVDVGYAQMSERIDDRVDDGSRCADRAKLTAAFHTERIVC